MNEIILNRLPGDLRTILSADSADFDKSPEGFHCDVEYLNSLTPGGCPPHK